MSEKIFPISKEKLEEIIKDYPTPFHIYDEKAIRANMRRLFKAFSWAPSFREHYAVKAAPNPRLLQVLHEEGAVHLDAAVPREEEPALSAREQKGAVRGLGALEPPKGRRVAAQVRAQRWAVRLTRLRLGGSAAKSRCASRLRAGRT